MPEVLNLSEAQQVEICQVLSKYFGERNLMLIYEAGDPKVYAPGVIAQIQEHNDMFRLLENTVMHLAMKGPEGAKTVHVEDK